MTPYALGKDNLIAAFKYSLEPKDTPLTQFDTSNFSKPRTELIKALQAHLDATLKTKALR